MTRTGPVLPRDEQIQDLRDVSPETLRILGTAGRLFQRFALGIDHREVCNVRVRKSMGSEMTLASDTWINEACLPWLESTARELADALQHKGLACSGVRFKLKNPVHQIQTRQMKLTQPTQAWQKIFGAAQHLARPFFGTTKVRLVGLSVYNLSEPSTQLELKL